MKLLIAAVLLLIGLLVYDCVGGKTEYVKATVVGREWVPAHYTYSTDSKGHTSSTYHPDDYTLIVETDNGVQSIDANKASYYTAYDGQHITFSQRRGCMSHAAWMKSYYK